MLDEVLPMDRPMMLGFPPSPEGRIAVDSVHSEPRRVRWFMQHMRESTRTAGVACRNRPVVRLQEEPRQLDSAPLPDVEGGSWTLSTMLEATHTDAIVVLRNGKIVYERYFHGMQPDSVHAYYSVSKSIASCVVANLVDRGVLNVSKRLAEYVPELARSAYADASVRHLLDMSVGIRYVENYEDDDSDDGRLQRLYGYKPQRSADEPGSSYDFAVTTKKEGEHGRVFHYVSLNTNVLGWVMERVTGVPAPRLIASEIWSKLGGEHDAYIALDGAGSAQLEAGFASSLRDLARFGQMLCQGGVFAGQLTVPSWWISDTRERGDRRIFAASADAGLLPEAAYRNGFWVSDRGDHMAIVGLGKYGQMIYVNQEAGVVIAKFSSQPRPSDDALTTLSFLGCDALAQMLR
jgi:CubicO group peptidase (beta-lactamase class C family)